jgi:hypothetical protein
MYTQEVRDSILERQRVSQLPLDEIKHQEVLSTDFGYTYGNGVPARSHKLVIKFESSRVYEYGGA